MLSNYLKIGLRNLLRNKLFTFINISGLAISLASFFIIALFIVDEWSFDRHVEDYRLKYRVFTERFNEDGGTSLGAMISPMIAPAMAEEFPEVDYYFRFMNFN